MTHSVASLWTVPAPKWFWEELESLLTPERCDCIFFRADDVGIVTDRFKHMVALFREYQTPLALAVVPLWVEDGGAPLMEYCPSHDPLFEWQMHGTTHENHATVGKKSEWCSERPLEDKRTALLWGRNILTQVLGKAPMVFTPPWNRCDNETLELLVELGFKAISRDDSPLPATPPELLASDICVDLHTRKETDPMLGWKHLLAELRTGMERGSCGIMLHHERMNEAAFAFLNNLLARIHMHRGNRRLLFTNKTNRHLG